MRQIGSQLRLLAELRGRQESSPCSALSCEANLCEEMNEDAITHKENRDDLEEKLRVSRCWTSLKDAQVSNDQQFSLHSFTSQVKSLFLFRLMSQGSPPPPRQLRKTEFERLPWWRFWGPQQDKPQPCQEAWPQQQPSSPAQHGWPAAWWRPNNHDTDLIKSLNQDCKKFGKRVTTANAWNLSLKGHGRDAQRQSWASAVSKSPYAIDVQPFENEFKNWCVLVQAIRRTQRRGSKKSSLQIQSTTLRRPKFVSWCEDRHTKEKSGARMSRTRFTWKSRKLERRIDSFEAGRMLGWSTSTFGWRALTSPSLTPPIWWA